MANGSREASRVTPMKRMLTLSGAGVVAALALGVALVAMGHGLTGWWLVLSAVIGSAVVAVAVIRGQRSLARVTQVSGHGGPSDREPGRPPVTAGDRHEVVQSRRWVGSASVPGSMGYVGIGVLLAVAEVGQGLLSLRVRPAVIRVMFGIENLAVSPDDGVVVFLAHKFGQEGVEIRLKGRPSYYFWVGYHWNGIFRTGASRPDDRHELLASAAAAGFEVSVEEQRARLR